MYWFRSKPGLLAACADAPYRTPAKIERNDMITHAVFFWLTNPGSIEDRDKLIAGIRGLAAIDVVRSLAVGVPAETGERDVVDGTYGVSEIITLDSVEDEAIYQDHPIHQKFIADHGHLWSKVTVYDITSV